MAKKFTKNQQKILDLIRATTAEISAQNLHFQIQQTGIRIGLATVYRTLKLLKIEGEIQERITPEGESVYSKIDAVEHHHHHLNCVNCGKSYPMASCPLEHQIDAWCANQALRKEFKIYYHTLEFFGLCGDCQSQETDAACLNAN